LSPAPGLTEVELFHADLRRHAFGRHAHEHYTIGITAAGRGGFRYRGSDVTTAPGGIVLLAPEEPHTGAPAADGWRYRDLFLAPDLVRRALDLPSGAPLPTFTAPVVDDPPLFAALDALFTALQQPAEMLWRDTLLLHTVVQLFARQGAERPGRRQSGQEPRLVREVRAYLEHHYAAEVPIADLAAHVGHSPTYLIRAFQRATGLPPHAFQLQLRLRGARQALRASTVPLAEVALAHGFADQSHLTRHFKRTFGVTPGQYRQDSFVQDRSSPDRLR
jgi:AraC-like DNA-binding protein